MLLVLGLGLKARSKFRTLALDLSGLGLEGPARFSLFGRYINPGMPSDSDVWQHERQLSWCSTWTLSTRQFHQHCIQHGIALQPLLQK